MLITFLSLFSFPDVGPDTDEIPHLDKAAHFVFYFVFALAACLMIRERRNWKIAMKNGIRFSLIAAILYGIIIEVLQNTFTQDRMAETGDVIANTLGAFAGVLLIKWYFSKERPLKWKF